MLEAVHLTFAYDQKAPVIDGVSIAIKPGQIVGLNGPSGCGKSTLGRLLAGYLTPASGKIRADGCSLDTRPSSVQYVHQSAVLAVDPRWRLGRIVEEAWQPDEETRKAVGVSRQWYDRFPHEVSGGELQRIVLLRALGPATRYLIADELTAMLDPISQARIWSLLRARADDGLGILAITHDRPLIERLTPHVMRMKESALP